MLSELQLKNVSSVFAIFDADNDAEITRDDFTTHATTHADALRLPQDSPHRGALSDAVLAYWEQIRAQVDANDDGSVTREEFIAAVDQGLLEDPHYLDRSYEYADALFAAADKNGDGTLGLSEMTAFYGAAGMSDEVAAGAFRQMDRDGDGKITADEFRAAIRGAYTGVGAETYGANFLGNA